MSPGSAFVHLESELCPAKEQHRKKVCICRKIDEAVNAGEDPYELKVEKRQKAEGPEEAEGVEKAERRAKRRAKPAQKSKGKKQRPKRK